MLSGILLILKLISGPQVKSKLYMYLLLNFKDIFPSCDGKKNGQDKITRLSLQSFVLILFLIMSNFYCHSRVSNVMEKFSFFVFLLWNSLNVQLLMYLERYTHYQKDYIDIQHTKKHSTCSTKIDRYFGVKREPLSIGVDKSLVCYKFFIKYTFDEWDFC